MDPVTLALLMGGGTALNEMTTGRQQQQRDAKMKANIYRLMAYQPRLNPESQQIYSPDPIGKGMQAGLSGYQLGSNINRNSAMERFFNKEAGVGGKTESEMESSPSNMTSGRALNNSGYEGLDGVPEQDLVPGNTFMAPDSRRSDLMLSRTKGQPDQIYRAEAGSWNPYRAMRGFS